MVELMVATCLLVVIPAWAGPAISDILSGVRVHSGAQALQHGLALTRSEAIKRNARVVMCKSSTGERCEPAGRWEQGWIVFQDPNNNRILDEDEVVVYHEPALSSALRVSGNAPVQDYVSYTPFGKTKLTSGAFQAGTFTVCFQADGEVTARQVVINSAGRVRENSVRIDRCA